MIDLIPPQARLAIALAALLVIGALIAGAGVKGYRLGAGHVQARWDKERAELEAEHATEVARLEAVNREVVVKYVPKVEYIRGETRYLTKEVPVYVTSEDDAACPSTAGLTRLHDRALGEDGMPPDPAPAGAAERPAAAPLSEIGTALVTNYAACRQYKARAEALTAWARSIQR